MQRRHLTTHFTAQDSRKKVVRGGEDQFDGQPGGRKRKMMIKPIDQMMMMMHLRELQQNTKRAKPFMLIFCVSS